MWNRRGAGIDLIRLENLEDEGLRLQKSENFWTSGSGWTRELQRQRRKREKLRRMKARIRTIRIWSWRTFCLNWAEERRRKRSCQRHWPGPRKKTRPKEEIA